MLFLYKNIVFFVCSSVVIWSNKKFRGKRGALSSDICCNDLFILFLISIGLTSVSIISVSILTILVGIFFTGYFVLIWLDSMLFIQYRVEINPQTIRWFFTGSKGVLKGLPFLLESFDKYKFGKIIPVLAFFYLWATLLCDSFIVLFFVKFVLLIYGALSVDILKNNKIYFIVVSVLLAFEYLFIQNYFPPYAAVLGLVIIHVIIVVSLLLLWGLKFKGGERNEFISSPSMLGSIFFREKFDPKLWVNINASHRDLLLDPRHSQVKSKYFGRCRGANIILITMESLGAYVQPFCADGMRSLLAEKFIGNSWVSKNHYCLCPNTTVSTNQIYTGAYSNNPYNRHDSLFPGEKPRHVQLLKNCGYKTLFLDSADVGLYDYYKLLRRINFDVIWGSPDIPANGLQSDYRLWNMVDVVADNVGQKPFFLHLINDQTHMPYQVVDHERFNTHKGAGDKAIYLNAMEEVDFIFFEFLRKLGRRLDLSNTIIIFTGDHGESFGESGYCFHSNSVIKQQVHVPFMLHHENLTYLPITHSCHFDIFPSLFDLLGVEYDYKCIGKSIGLAEGTGEMYREKKYLFHSATLKGNTPANFSILFGDEFFWVDRLFNRTVYSSDLDNNEKKISSELNDYFCSLLCKMMIDRKLMVNFSE